MNITYTSVLAHGLESSAALLTQGFSDYFVPIKIPVAGLFAMVRQDSVDLNLSRVILHDDQPVGVALIARRGWTSRLAAMSIIPQARGRGIGAFAVHQLLTDAKARGDRAMTLEVIEQNSSAVRLYEKCGFTTLRRLVGYIGQPRVAEPDIVIEQVDIREVARALIAHGPNDLPWQISGETLAQTTPPAVAYKSADSYVVLSEPVAPTIRVLSILTVPDARRQGSATSLLRAAIARYPEKTWRAAPHYPEEIGGLFEKIGLAPDKLSQWQMSISL